MDSQVLISRKGFGESIRHPDKELASQKTAVLMTLLGVAKTHNKAYCWVSQNRQLELLSKYHYWNISRRTLNRRLKELVEEGYIIRIRRHIKNGQGGIRFNSTLYKFTKRVFIWLRKLGNFVRKAFSFARVPHVAHHSTLREEEISKGFSGNVEILWKTDEKGVGPPIRGIL